MIPRRIPPAAGQESVWDYPRPPRLEQSTKRLVLVFADVVVADTRRAWRVLETSHPPVYYLPPAEVRMDLLQRAPGSSFCEWKGAAVYWTLRVGDREATRVAWSYPTPTAAFASLRDHLAFYAAPFDRCTADGEAVTPQPGRFYGGWITRDVVGPFKGERGTEGW